MASYTGLKKLGDGLLDYMMKHRPEVDEDMSAGLHDLEGMFPGIYGKSSRAYSTHSGSDVDSEAMGAINAVRGNPDAEVDIFRAVPKGVRDINTGDWVTTSKSYAHKHGGHALNDEYDIITGKVKASDLFNPGDSIAEMGYWGLPMAGTVTRGLIPAVGAGGMLALLGADEAEAAVEKDFVDNFVKAAKRAAKKEPGEEVILGETPEEAFRLLKEIYPNLNDPVARIVYPHGVVSRADQMTAAQQAKLYADAYNDETLKAVRNKPGNDRSDAALWHQGKKISSFFPVKERNGHPLILTGMPKKTKDIQKYLVENRWGLGGRTEDPSILVTPQSLGIEVPSGQPVRTFSAVSPNMGNTIRGLDAWRKSKLPTIAGTMTGLSAPTLYPEEAYAGKEPAREPGLESPTFDPIDILLAPIGAVGAGAKAAAMATDPVFSYGMDKLAGLLGKLWED